MLVFQVYRVLPVAVVQTRYWLLWEPQRRGSGSGAFRADRDLGGVSCGVSVERAGGAYLLVMSVMAMVAGLTSIRELSVRGVVAGPVADRFASMMVRLAVLPADPCVDNSGWRCSEVVMMVRRRQVTPSDARTTKLLRWCLMAIARISCFRARRSLRYDTYYYGRDWKDVDYDEFRGRLTAYLTHYNEARIKKSRGWMSPVQYRKHFGMAA